GEGLPGPDDVLKTVAGDGILMSQFGPRRLRAVTHRDVDEAGVRRAAEALAGALDL
ncbi:MAG: low specificity L-threonine aldolase, partial [Gemmatimonadetes bacterium]